MAKYTNYIIILVLFVVACNNTTTRESSTTTTTTDTTITIHKDTISPRQWIIMDSSRYSKKFLDELYNYKDDSGHSVSLINDYIVLKNDTSYFPDYFVSNRQLIFEGKNDSGYYKLMIFNGNYTSALFSLSVIGNDKKLQHYTGSIDMLPGSFLAYGKPQIEGLEGDDSNVDSAFFNDYEYSGVNEKYDYELHIGIKANTLFAMINCSAKDTVKDRSVNDCPVLSSGIKFIPRRK